MSEDPKSMMDPHASPAASQGATAGDAAHEDADSAAGVPFPLAETRVRPAWRRWVGFAMIPVLAVVITIGVLIWVRAEQGLIITVRFQEGHGVKPGNSLKYRGIVIGEVVTARINPELNRVVVQIELEKQSEAIARDGSIFWIERPQVSLSRVRGLDTVVGARYVVVAPGPPGGASRTSFVGVEHPATLTSESVGTVIKVRFLEGHGLTIGDVLKFRGIEFGEVAGLEINPDLSGVTVTVRLLRDAERVAVEGSRFWIVRPQMSLKRVQGLDTIVGARYLAVSPGPAGAPRRLEFVGLEEPPTFPTQPTALKITINFRSGHGIQVGDPLKHRGIVVGEVTRVSLNSELSGVTVAVGLIQSAALLARTGSQFWIERPKISLTEVRGLDTAVKGRYLGVVPGPAGTAPRTVFSGLESPPVMIERAEGGLDIILEGDTRMGLEPGAPLLYRGVQVGSVLTVRLASDSGRIVSRVYVRPAYRNLVRNNTRFWNISGVDLEVSLLAGFSMNLESLQTFAQGGVMMATPTEPGKPVATGHRFEIVEDPQREWLRWRPQIPTGRVLLPDGAARPQPLWAVLSWRRKGIWGSRGGERRGWLLPLEGSVLLGPADLLQPVAGAADGVTELSVAGQKIQVRADAVTVDGRLAVYLTDEFDLSQARRWPRSRLRRPEKAEPCLFMANPEEEPMALALGRVTVQKERWIVDEALSLDRRWHGACMVSRVDGLILGILTINAGKAEIQLIPAGLIP